MKLIPTFLIKFTGDFYIHKHPFFGVYKPSHHKVKGDEVRNILDTLLPGDILLRRYDGYLNTLFTPGFWGHAAIAIDNTFIIHSVSKGVVKEDILEFSRTDSLCILRLNYMNYSSYIHTAIDRANDLANRRIAYDYDFDSKNDKFYCTEMVDYCYGGIFKDEYVDVLTNRVLTPDHIYDSEHTKTILEIRH